MMGTHVPVDGTQSWWSKPMHMPCPFHVPLPLQHVFFISFLRNFQKRSPKGSQQLTQISELNTCQGVPGPKFHVGIINYLGHFVETRNILGSEWCFCPRNQMMHDSHRFEFCLYYRIIVPWRRPSLKNGHTRMGEENDSEVY